MEETQIHTATYKASICKDTYFVIPVPTKLHILESRLRKLTYELFLDHNHGHMLVIPRQQEENHSPQMQARAHR